MKKAHQMVIVDARMLHTEQGLLPAKAYLLSELLKAGYYSGRCVFNLLVEQLLVFFYQHNIEPAFRDVDAEEKEMFHTFTVRVKQKEELTLSNTINPL
jgi:hypothetical protein